MQSDHLTTSQLETLADKIRPMLMYLARLERRMEAIGFVPQDRLLVAVRQARQALQDVHLELHYLSCEGVGRPARPRDG